MELLNRCDYIGGSDIATIMFQNDYGDIENLYKKKVENLYKPIVSCHIDRGITMEPFVFNVIKSQMDESILGIAPYQIRLQHQDYPFLLGHIDGIGLDFIYEIKCPTMVGVDRLSREGVYKEYFWQVCYYQWLALNNVNVNYSMDGIFKRKLEVKEYNATVVVFNYNGWCLDPYEIPYNAEYHQIMEHNLINFWNAVQSKDVTFLDAMIRPDIPNEMLLTDSLGIEFDELCYDFNSSKALKKIEEQEYKNSKLEIMQFLKLSRFAETDNYRVELQSRSTKGREWFLVNLLDKNKK